MTKEDYSENRARYKAFMLLVGALVIVLIGNTICLWFAKMDAAAYEKVLLMLGVPTLLGMAFHAFFNDNKEEIKNVKKDTDISNVPDVSPASKSGN